MKNFTLVQKIYLELLCAENYPEQEPVYKKAKWYHLFWLLIPIIEFLLFTTYIENL
jgi:hypothetical protein